MHFFSGTHLFSGALKARWLFQGRTGGSLLERAHTKNQEDINISRRSGSKITNIPSILVDHSGCDHVSNLAQNFLATVTATPSQADPEKQARKTNLCSPRFKINIFLSSVLSISFCICFAN